MRLRRPWIQPRSPIVAAAPHAGAARRWRRSALPAEVIVRLEAEGPHAVTECAAAQHRRGRPLAAIARDRSDSLDRLNAELGVRAVRAVFRPSDGRPLAAVRASLAARARARRDALPAADARGAARGAGARGRLPPRAAARRRRGGGRRALCGGSARGVGAGEPRGVGRSGGERSVPRVERILGPALRRSVGDPARARARGLGPLAGRGGPRGRQRHGHRRASTPTSRRISG